MCRWNRNMTAAPRDGTEFQVWVVGYRGAEFWEPRARFNPDSGAFEMWGRTGYDEEGWDVYPDCTPTHWMFHPSNPTPRS